MTPKTERPKIFPAIEERHDNRTFSEIMADLGVEIIRRNPAGILISPLVAGVAKTLERMGDAKVSVKIIVEQKSAPKITVKGV